MVSCSTAASILKTAAQHSGANTRFGLSHSAKIYGISGVGTLLSLLQRWSIRPFAESHPTVVYKKTHGLPRSAWFFSSISWWIAWEQQSAQGVSSVRFSNRILLDGSYDSFRCCCDSSRKRARWPAKFRVQGLRFRYVFPPPPHHVKLCTSGIRT